MTIHKERFAAAQPDDPEVVNGDDAYFDYEEDGAEYYDEPEQRGATQQLVYSEGDQDDLEDGAADDEAYAEQDAAAPRSGSMLPLILASAGGVVVVVGLLLFMLLRSGGGVSTPPKAANGSQANGVVDATKELPRAGYLAPDFSLTDVKGGTVKLSSFRGQNAVWLNFWATWCEPCRQEMPEMEKLYPQYQPKGVEIVGVDVAEAKDLVTGFLNQNRFSWNFALDTNSETFRKYFSTGIPTHIFIRRDGVISSVIIGGLSQPMMVTELNKIAQ